MPKSKFVQWVERSITEVILEDLGDITSIGQYAFYGCSGLTSITIPDSVTSIGSYAFNGCRGLTSITIPDSVISIGFAAFISCSSLTSITIPNSVTSIGNYAFEGCSGLTKIEVAEGNTVYHSAGDCLIETNSKTLILGCKNSVIPTDDSVTSIGDSAFRGCNDITSIIIPDGVTSIDSSAFSNCRGLTSITISSSVASLGGSACYNCSNLINITALSVIPPAIQSSTFTNVPSTCTITVPYQSLDAYKSAQYWSDRANYIVPTSWRDYYYYKMNGLADAINEKAGTSDVKTIDEMTQTVNSIRNVNNLIGANTIYVDPYHLTYLADSPYFTIDDGSYDPDSGRGTQGWLFWDSYDENLDGNYIQTINGHLVSKDHALRYSFYIDDGGSYQEYTTLCYYDGISLYWISTSISVGFTVVNVTYYNSAYASLFSNILISYGDFSKTSNLTSQNIKADVVVGADSTVHNAGVLGSFLGSNTVDHDLTNTNIPYINTYGMRWLTMFSAVISGYSTIIQLDVTAYAYNMYGEEIHVQNTDYLRIIVRSGSATVNGYVISFTHILEYCHTYYNSETDEFDQINTTIAYYDQTTNKIYWVHTCLPEGEGIYSLSIDHVTYTDSTYGTLFSASPVAFGGFLVNTNANTIKDTVVVGKANNVNEGIKGTFLGELYDISDAHVVYINPYHSLWSTLVSQNTIILDQYCDYGPNPWGQDPDPEHYNDDNRLYWGAASGSTTVNGFTITYTRRLTYKYDYWQENPEDPAQSYLDTAYAPIAYYDGTKIYWVTTVLDMAPFDSVISITYGSSTYKYLFANSLVAYGNFIYKDSDLLPANVRENTVVGDRGSNAGLRGLAIPAPAWLPTLGSTWTDIYFNRQIAWDDLFAHLESAQDPTYGKGYAVLSDINYMHAGFAAVLFSVPFGAVHKYIVTVVQLQGDNIDYVPIYASDDMDTTVTLVENTLHVVARKGWNTDHVDLLRDFHFAGSTVLVPSDSTALNSVNNSFDSVPFTLTSELSITDTNQLWSGKSIAFGSYTPTPTEGELIIDSNGVYTFEELSRYSRIVVAINPQDSLQNAQITTTYSTDDTLAFDDPYTFAYDDLLATPLPTDVSSDGTTLEFEDVET